MLTNVCVFSLHADSFSKLPFFKRFHFGDRLENFLVLKDFAIEIVFQKRSVFNLDYIFIALDCLPPQGKYHGVSSLDEHFFALRANVGIKYYLNNNKQTSRTMALNNDTRIRDPIKSERVRNQG